jgi:NAD(P)-dependent dehydrogenase (short-subunit alcohol dehydrogenase family)
VADLASLAEVRALAGAVRARGRLDALVNNAGIGSSVPGGGERMKSEDGLELRFAVNYSVPPRRKRPTGRRPTEPAARRGPPPQVLWE